MKDVLQDRGRRFSPVTFIALSLALLAMTLAWGVPIMLWDHLDLLPVYEDWRNGALLQSDAWHVHHGSHLHVAAYLVLLATTELSANNPWLDWVVNWILLLAYASALLAIAFRVLPVAGPSWWAGLVFLVLYPGHLANLQWGWQVAVFLCLLGLAVSVWALTGRSLTWRRNLLAITASILACASFATGFALLPICMGLILMRADIPLRRRWLLAVPWLVVGVSAAWGAAVGLHGGGGFALDPFALLVYAMNFLGSGVARFATDAAPWLAFSGLLSGVYAARLRGVDSASRPWLALMCFGACSAMLVAIGRAAPFGVEQAFASRYVSFSSTFWVGWFGLIWLARREGGPVWQVVCAWLVGVVMLFALGNAIHLAKNAADVGRRAAEITARIRASYPCVDEALLREIYFDQPEVAMERLRILHARGLAPFGVTYVRWKDAATCRP